MDVSNLDIVRCNEMYLTIFLLEFRRSAEEFESRVILEQL